MQERGNKKRSCHFVVCLNECCSGCWHLHTHTYKKHICTVECGWFPIPQRNLKILSYKAELSHFHEIVCMSQKNNMYICDVVLSALTFTSSKRIFIDVTMFHIRKMAISEIGWYFLIFIVGIYTKVKRILLCFGGHCVLFLHLKDSKRLVELCINFNTKESAPHIYAYSAPPQWEEKRNKHILMNIINTRNKIK